MPVDPSKLAKKIIDEATREESDDEKSESERREATSEARREAGQSGGASRAEKLTPEQRQVIAETAARARWKRRKGSA